MGFERRLRLLVAYVKTAVKADAFEKSSLTHHINFSFTTTSTSIKFKKILRCTNIHTEGIHMVAFSPNVCT